jgi:hypothetical protein
MAWNMLATVAEGRFVIAACAARASWTASLKLPR